MTMHGSAIALQETPHAGETPHATEANTNPTISDALRRRAQSVINDNSIDPRWRGIIRYALEIDDPWLADLVRRADAGEPIIDSIHCSLEPETLKNDSSEDKIEPLLEMICGSRTEAGTEPAAALFVLMGTVENSTHPKLLANAAKHFAFKHCAELNLFGIVDAQIAVFEGELLGNSRTN